MKKLEYKDKFGNLVETVVDSGGLDLATQFTYDVLGHLTSSTSPAGLVTTYTYNTLGQLTSKSTPNSGTTQYLYDNVGNLRFIKDANEDGVTPSQHVLGSGTDQTSGTYSGFTITQPTNVQLSIYETSPVSGTSDNLRIFIVGPVEPTLASLTCSSSTAASDSIYLPAGTYYYQTSVSGSNTFDFEISWNTVDEFQIRNYDAFNRLTWEGMFAGTTASGDFNQSNADNEDFQDNSNLIFARQFYYGEPSGQQDASGQTNLRGRISYTEVYGINANQERFTSYSYDNRGRLDWKVVWGSALYYPKKLTYSYDLQGDLTQRGDIDQDWRANPFYWMYSYNQAGQLANVEDSINVSGSGTAWQEAGYTQFASGNTSQMTLGSGPVATVNYNYNQRGWVTNINSSDYWEDVYYNTSPGFTTTPEYNGNISAVTYYISGLSYTDVAAQNAATSTLGWAYSYDNANRLTDATFYLYGHYVGGGSNTWQTTGSYNVSGITYDADGNIQGLQRNQGNDAALDDLSYSYDNDMVDYITNTAGSGAGYLYNNDYDGNLITDQQDGVAFTIYDIYNEPVEVYLSNGTNYTYGYDVDGARILKNWNGGDWTFYLNDPDGKTDAVILGPTSSDVNYNIWAGSDNIGEIMYNGSYTTYYYLKNHLGNISVILNSNGGVDSYNNYYPFGMQMPGTSTTTMNLSGSADGRYKFSSKELDAETSLYYFGARYYDPWSGRWMSVDPLANKYPGWSPYNYVEDDPVLIVDPNGKGGIIQDLMNLLQPLESAFGMNNPPQGAQQQEDQTTQAGQVLTSAGEAAGKLPAIGVEAGVHGGGDASGVNVDAAVYYSADTWGNSALNASVDASVADMSLAGVKYSQPLLGDKNPSLSASLLGVGTSSNGKVTLQLSASTSVEVGSNSISYQLVLPVPVVFIGFTYTESTGN